MPYSTHSYFHGLIFVFVSFMVWLRGVVLCSRNSVFIIKDLRIIKVLLDKELTVDIISIISRFKDLVQRIS